jgi:hypothetical protein
MFMPTGYWHHMQYLDCGFAMSLRAMPEQFSQKLNGLYHLVPMRNINNLLIKLAPEWWYHKKRELAHSKAKRALETL